MLRARVLRIDSKSKFSRKDAKSCSGITTNKGAKQPTKQTTTKMAWRSDSCGGSRKRTGKNLKHCCNSRSESDSGSSSDSDDCYDGCPYSYGNIRLKKSYHPCGCSSDEEDGAYRFLRRRDTNSYLQSQSKLVPAKVYKSINREVNQILNDRQNSTEKSTKTSDHGARSNKDWFSDTIDSLARLSADNFRISNGTNNNNSDSSNNNNSNNNHNNGNDNLSDALHVVVHHPEEAPNSSTSSSTNVAMAREERGVGVVSGPTSALPKIAFSPITSTVVVVAASSEANPASNVATDTNVSGVIEFPKDVHNDQQLSESILDSMPELACVYCHANKAVVMLEDCYHVCFCITCIGTYIAPGRTCPKCRAPIKKARKVFF